MGSAVSRAGPRTCANDMTMELSPQTAQANRPRWTWQWLPLLLLMIVVLEVVTRLEERVSYGVPLLSRVSGPGDLVWMHPDGARGRPRARYQKWGLNQLGFRGPEISRVPQSGTTRIVVVGASETFGLYETWGREYARQLEDSLQARSPAACSERAPSIEVVNAALPGLATPSMEVLINNVVRPTQPDVIVLYPSPGFYLNQRAPTPTRGEVGADTALPVRNALRFRVFGRAERQLKALTPNAVKGLLRQMVLNRRSGNQNESRFNEIPPERMAQFEADLRRVVGTARSTGAKVVLMGYANATMEPAFSDSVLIGAWMYQFPRATGKTLVDFHARAYELERDIARDSGLMFVDLPGAFKDRWKGSFADFVHFTDAGAAIVAATLAETLRTSMTCAP